ncbi:hypothetical protein [Dinoroseobacter sp. S124A]|uniref:hypothetical protein n=1 Tax=Dinoroseobacter sp. S124A TaxID=3415128 RepID=UPI003C7AA4B1
MTTLTDAELFCLYRLAHNERLTPYDISKRARDAQINKTRLWPEWAAPRLRQLREFGFVEKTGDPAGRAELQQREEGA